MFPDMFLKSTVVFGILLIASFGMTYVMGKIPGLKKFVCI